ncbi:MAG: NAAT family transporter [Gemmatimonadetes bacterium]|nr:NAAT family transporter [Gemmatimonadota bacterium]
MSPDIAFGLVAFTSLLAIYNPLSAVPVFVALTADEAPGERRQTAVVAVVASVVVLLAFAVGGRVILAFFGITTEAFQIAGGIIFFGVGSDMLQAKRTRLKTTKKEEEEASLREHIGVIPLGLPTLTGPGSIVTVIALLGQASNGLQTGLVYLSIVAVGAVTLPLLLLAPSLMAALGRTGLNVLVRLMGLLVMVIGVQFVIDGTGGVLEDWGLRSL